MRIVWSCKPVDCVLDIANLITDSISACPHGKENVLNCAVYINSTQLQNSSKVKTN